MIAAAPIVGSKAKIPGYCIVSSKRATLHAMAASPSHPRVAMAGPANAGGRTANRAPAEFAQAASSPPVANCQARVSV